MQQIRQLFFLESRKEFIRNPVFSLVKISKEIFITKAITKVNQKDCSFCAQKSFSDNRMLNIR